MLAEERYAFPTATTPTRILVFSYDENNTPIGFQFKGTSGVWYYYVYAKNIQGDIVALYRRDTDSDGNKSLTHIANYEYDPWGKTLSIKSASGSTITNPDNSALINPLRYRGYYYDNESGFYYLQSRYYDPSIGRFINADSYASTGQDFLGYNMFAYCNNNPTDYSDPTGEWGFLSSLLASVAVVAAAVAVVAIAVVTAGAAVPVVAAATGATLSSAAATSALATTAIVAVEVAGACITGVANLEQDYINFSINPLHMILSHINVLAKKSKAERIKIRREKRTALSQETIAELESLLSQSITRLVGIIVDTSFRLNTNMRLNSR